jgi:hypothetical protein
LTDGVYVAELIEGAVDGEAEQAVRAGVGGVRQGHAGPLAQHRVSTKGNTVPAQASEGADHLLGRRKRRPNVRVMGREWVN